ncbi:hypothetical protein [Streptomyces sp. NPDC057199]|uniref:hypothetical protein n=1 Tax=Streptomyces sp. NPDC057199 TaxID=3346047 RepID=UPI003641716B
MSRGQPGEGAGWSYALARLLGDGTLPRRPLAPLCRVFAVPEAVAEMAESLVRSWHTPIGEDGAEWEQAHEARTAIDAVGSQFVSRKRWWPSARRRYCGWG